MVAARVKSVGGRARHQGHTLAHVSAQSESFLDTEATAGVHLATRTETFVGWKLPT
jgi:hypothetical protein